MPAYGKGLEVFGEINSYMVEWNSAKELLKSLNANIHESKADRVIVKVVDLLQDVFILGYICGKGWNKKLEKLTQDLFA